VLDNWHASGQKRPVKHAVLKEKKGQKIFKNRAKNA